MKKAMMIVSITFTALLCACQAPTSPTPIDTAPDTMHEATAPSPDHTQSVSDRTDTTTAETDQEAETASPNTVCWNVEPVEGTATPYVALEVDHSCGYSVGQHHFTDYFPSPSSEKYTYSPQKTIHVDSLNIHLTGQFLTDFSGVDQATPQFGYMIPNSDGGYRYTFTVDAETEKVIGYQYYDYFQENNMEGKQLGEKEFEEAVSSIKEKLLSYLGISDTYVLMKVSVGTKSTSFTYAHIVDGISTLEGLRIQVAHNGDLVGYNAYIPGKMQDVQLSAPIDTEQLHTAVTQKIATIYANVKNYTITGSYDPDQWRIIRLDDGRIAVEVHVEINGTAIGSDESYCDEDVILYVVIQ